MGKLRRDRVGNHWLYITSKCTPSGEPPHIHTNKNPQLKPSTSGKIWVYQDGTSRVERPADATKAELNTICDWIADNVAVIQGEWERMGGMWIWFSR